jgi:hypothetical protein
MTCSQQFSRLSIGIIKHFSASAIIIARTIYLHPRVQQKLLGESEVRVHGTCVYEGTTLQAAPSHKYELIPQFFCFKL